MKVFALSLALGGLTAAIAIFGPKDVLDKHASKLKEANSLTALFTVQQVPGTPTTYTLSYSKPNMVIIESPSRLIETDGKTVWEYNKLDKSYSESPLASGSVPGPALANEGWAWAAFFSPDALKNLETVTLGGTRTIKGNAVTELNFTISKPTKRSGTLFIDNRLGFARGVSIKDGDKETLIMATELTTSAEPLPLGKFTFVPPDGAKKIEVASGTQGGDVTYASVEPIFKRSCSGCHNSVNARGGFSVNSYEELMAGDHGHAIVPGDPANSSVVGYIEGTLRPRMPKGGAPLPSSDIEAIKAWIKAGAKK